MLRSLFLQALAAGLVAAGTLPGSTQQAPEIEARGPAGDGSSVIEARAPDWAPGIPFEFIYDEYQLWAEIGINVYQQTGPKIHDWIENYSAFDYSEEIFNACKTKYLRKFGPNYRPTNLNNVENNAKTGTRLFLQLKARYQRDPARRAEIERQDAQLK